MRRFDKSDLNFVSTGRIVVKQTVLIALTLLVPLVFVASSMADDKRGLGGDDNSLITGINSNWYYNWKLGINPDVAHAEFVPMFWSGGNVNTANVQNIISNSSSEYVLGFNEPERTNQSNMTVATALSKWSELQPLRDAGFKLVSPAPSDTADGREWLDDFMAGVDADPNLEVDEIAFHWYGTVNPNNPTGSANSFLNKVDQYWNNYGRPVWVTEFAGIDWAGNYDTATMQEANRVFLETAIAGLESRAHVTRYAWWNHNNDSRLLANGTSLPTATGEAWIDTIFDNGEQFDINGQSQGDDVFYLRGGELTNTGSSIPLALRYVDASEGTSVISGTSDYGFQNSDPGYLRVRSGSTLWKEGSNTVTLPGTQFINDGNTVIQDGTLQLEGAAQLTGSGILRVTANSVLATSGGAGGQSVALDSSQIIMNQGVLHVKDGRAEISQQFRFWNPSEVRTDGDLLVHGFTTGSGRILSTGTGTLFLRGEGQHANGATVSQGGLIVANSTVSATGAGSVTVNGTGTFGGYGQVAGNVVVEAGGAIAPGVSQGSAGATSAPLINEGVVVNAIDFDFTGVQDDAPLTQTSNLSGGLQLISGLNFGSGVQPRGASNNGNEFNVMGFPVDDNYGAAGNNGDYLTFTIAPVTGLAMLIEDVTFELRRNGSGAAEEYVIGTSIDGFAWADRWGWLDLAAADTSTHTFTASNPGNEPVTEEVEIRIVGMDAVNSFGNTHFYAASVDASFISDPNEVAFDPTGILQLGGDYTQSDFATLKVDLASAAAGEFDQLQVSGNVVLDGTLDVSFLDGFNPAVGQTFDIITANSVAGTFSNVIAPGGANVQVNYLGSIVRLEIFADALNCDSAGGVECDIVDIDSLYASFGSNVNPGAGFDYSGNGVIGPEDIAGWLADASQATNTANPTGATYVLGDADLDGSVGSTDLGLLLNNFGASSNVGWSDGNLDGDVTVSSTDLGQLLNNFGFTSPLAVSTVPEPSNALFVLALSLFIAARFLGPRRR